MKILKKYNLLEKRFGRLVVIAFAGTKNHRYMWDCRCNCGNKTTVRGVDLRAGKTRSCQCLMREAGRQNAQNYHNSNIDKTRGDRHRNDGYIYKMSKKHPYCSKEGYVAEHRLEMEKKIKRFLKKREVVHHWKGKENNHENLCLFRSNSPHFRLHLFSKRHKIDIIQLKFNQPWL